ncbi:MAG: hypothetical protein JXR03_20605 [Cyclobacteriaceae bacterium]
MRKILLIVLLGLSLSGLSQQIKYEGMWRPTFSIRQSANTEDYILGFTVGASTPQRNTVFYGSFDFRPYRKKIQERQSGNFYHQYGEQRFFTGVGAEHLYRFKNDSRGLFANINGNFTWGDYGGTYAKPQKGWHIVPRVGFFQSFLKSTTFLKIGYEYLDSKSEVLEHRLFFSLMFVIGKS